ncbi:MAG TPA: Xaa-Pro peptidase family protein [Acidimicrobiales bacterium]|nr:Xaa-Pro peptidase family protein [Acidimicrobiales bacterium]
MTSDRFAAAVFGTRLERVRASMVEKGIEALFLSLGADLPWLTGYEAMPLERLTMLVVPAEGEVPTLVVPALEAPRVVERPEIFRLRPWAETEDPVGIVASLAGDAHHLAISDRAWATFVVRLQSLLPGRRWALSSSVCSALRAVKDPAEAEALAKAGASADRVAEALLGGDIALVGRTEREVSAEISRRLLEEGHDRVNFAIVASGPNAASPHHEPSDRIIERGEPVVCDFGGVLDGYCSDTTRTVFTGEPPASLRRIYETVLAAQQAGVAAAAVGTPCQEVDRASRRVIEDAGYGQYFVHRTGHGIGREEHEDPYMVEGNADCIVAGHAFSVEPGIYVPGQYGVRIEDIVLATAQGPRSLNVSNHSLAVIG